MTTLTLIILNLISAGVIYFTAQFSVAEQIKDLVAPPPLIEHYSFGLRPQVADAIWVRSIQDFDYCDNPITQKTCKGQSWLFHMLDAVTNLDSKYLNAYSAGGLALTVLISDYEGASKLFDKGTAEFPDDWVLNYRAAYHALYEEHNTEKAARLYERVAKTGGPEWGVNLAGRLRTKEGKVEIANRLLHQMINRNEDEIFIRRLREKIEQFKAE